MKTNKEIVDTSTIKALANSYESINSEQLHRDEFMQRVKAMTMDELKMIVDYVPVELCMERINKELESAKQLKNSIIGLSSSL